MKRIALATVAAMVLAGPTSAAVCDTGEAIVDLLANDHGEVLLLVLDAPFTDGVVSYALFANATQTTWSLAAQMDNGSACIVDAGFGVRIDPIGAFASVLPTY